MSQQIGGYPRGTHGVRLPVRRKPTTQVARDEATDVGRTAADAGRQVAGTAAEQAANVAQEVKTQARDLVGEARGQVQGQARAGQQKAADGIRALSQELREMADGGQQSGTVSEVARQAADRADNLAEWLGRREPGDLVDEVRSFARRRPGAFLLGAAVAGVVVGRLTRGAVDSARTDSGPAPQHLAGHRPTYRVPGQTPAVTVPDRCRSTPRRRRRATRSRRTCPRRRRPRCPRHPRTSRRWTRSTGPPASTSTTSSALWTRLVDGPLDDPYRSGRGDFR